MAASVGPVPAMSDEVTPVREAAPSFEAFYEDTHTRLYTALCLVTGSRHEAEEVVQEAFVRVWERWDKVGRLDAPTGYLYRAAMNLVRSRYRRASLALRRTVGLAPRTDDLAAVEDRVVVAGALRSLTPSQRAAVVLISMFGLPSEEAGRILDMKPSAVRTLAARARASMRDEVGELT
jgi:RNA polymerase sigma-70 factor (ECF subfamily)